MELTDYQCFLQISLQEFVSYDSIEFFDGIEYYGRLWYEESTTNISVMRDRDDSKVKCIRFETNEYGEFDNTSITILNSLDFPVASLGDFNSLSQIAGTPLEITKLPKEFKIYTYLTSVPNTYIINCSATKNKIEQIEIIIRYLSN